MDVGSAPSSSVNELVELQQTLETDQSMASRAAEEDTSETEVRMVRGLPNSDSGSEVEMDDTMPAMQFLQFMHGSADVFS